jgi:hypothetical protein
VNCRITGLAGLTLLAFVACRPEPSTVEPIAQPVVETPPEALGLDADRLREWVSFLADDAQLGRPPGGDADARVRAFVAEKMEAFGLEPAGNDGFFQTFEVTDGVRLREGAESRLVAGKAEIEHHVVPFGHDTGEAGPVSSQLVYVGHGIAGDEKGTGDYAKLAKRVKGKIVVALAGGPDDPHIAPSKLRPQTKLITARDHGAVGFVLWDPQTDVPFPNHGKVADLELPAVFVGAAGTPALLAALGAKAKKPDALKSGQRGKTKVELETPVEPVVLETANVVGRLPGNGSSKQVLVVGAHLDHLGMGTASSLAPGERAVHNGADDNASGVATMLGIARAYESRPVSERARDVVFVAFGAEEMGLLGSKHMVESMSAEDRERTVAMLNFDMVGRLGDELIVNGTGTAAEWKDLLTSRAGDLKLSFVPDGYGPSDHSSFYEVEIPVLHFFTGAHEDYHRPSDDIEKVNFEGAARVGELALSVLDDIDEPATVLSYVKTEKKTSSRGGFKVSLGTMPDYAADVDGLMLDGVRGGGAAEKAGLKKGDLIVKIGERNIHGIDDFMASFAVMEPGKGIVFVVVRDGKQEEIEVIPSAPRPH